jgi:peptidoglycan/LPS O-acetylase OafA/YrhL
MTASERRPDLDVLRVLASFLLLLFHVAMVFSPAPFFHVRNGDTALPFLVLCGFISLWHMPLFFLLAGWSAHASLAGRGVGAFVRERIAKLFVPLVAGCVLFVPFIKYVELRGGQDMSHTGLRVSPETQESFRGVLQDPLPAMAPFDESFVAFLPTFFTDVDRFTWSHLWFLAYLFTFTMLLLPVLVAGVRRAPRDLGPRLRRVLVYAPIAPLALIQVFLAPRFPGPYNLYDDWAHVAFFATFLLSGTALARNPELERTAHAEWRRALAIGMGATLLLLGAVLEIVTWPPLILALTAVAGWCLVVALLGYARARARGGARLSALTRVAFPVYVLHQPVIVLLGAFIVALPLGILAKFLLLLSGSTLGTLGLIGALSRVAPLRPLLGLPTPTRPLPPPPRAANAGRVGA